MPRFESPVELASTFLEVSSRSAAPDVAPSGRARFYCHPTNGLMLSVSGGGYSAFAQAGDLSDYLTAEDIAGLTANPEQDAIDLFGSVEDLPEVPASFADEAAVKTYLDSLVTALDARLHGFETKIDAILTALIASAILETPE